MFPVPLPYLRMTMSARRFLLLLTGAMVGANTHAADSTPGSARTDSAQLDQIDVVAQQLDSARSSIETHVGASVYTIDAASIAAMPGGDNSLLNQTLLQAPVVSQDSFGQFHVRGEHNGLQYRINGIILPEGVSVFGQSLDPRLISSMDIITGALPAEYGLRTAGIIDLTTKSGLSDLGGALSLYGGSHGTVEPSVAYGGSLRDGYRYFVSADAVRNRLGIESPDGSSNPVHDATLQAHGFFYLEKILNAQNRLSLIASASGASFQIPDVAGLQPQNPDGRAVNGQTTFDSASLNETQHEDTQFLILAWQHSADGLDFQHALTLRNSSLQYTPDLTGDLLFNGIAQDAFRKNVAVDSQADLAWKLTDAHTVRTGWFLQSDRSTSRTSSWVFDLSVSPPSLDGPKSDGDTNSERIESVYLQDEWSVLNDLTLNLGLRYDTFKAFTSANQLSPRVNAVWKPTGRSTVHAGYSRYLTPPPFELISTELLNRFAGTSGAGATGGGPPGGYGGGFVNDSPKAERANYFDLGVLFTLAQNATLNLDSYVKRSSQLIDEGQFGAPIILTPFNYQEGRQMGAEANVTVTGRDFTAYANLAWQLARGRNIDSAQFNFSPQDLAYIATHFIDLDHEQKFTASGGGSYRWGATRLSADLIVGSGLRADYFGPNGVNIPNGTHLPYYSQINAGASHEFSLGGPRDNLTLRFDIINLFNRDYEIRNGTGVGVGAPQFGPRRGFFFGVARSL